MDIMRAGYTTRARFFVDSDTEASIRWYRALPNAPVLGFPSAINSLNWSDTPWERTGVGEVYGSPRPFSGKLAPPEAKGDHVCGSRSDFVNGEHFDPSLPPTIYGANGLPVCCDNPPERVATGGSVSGGTAGVHLVVPEHSTGGSVSGGTADVWVTSPGASTGGSVSGGTADVSVVYLFCDSYTIDPPVEGRTTLVRAVPDAPIWGPTTPAAISLQAVIQLDDGTALWDLVDNVGGIGAFWRPDSPWDGKGTRTFFPVPDTPAIGNRDVTCAD